MALSGQVVNIALSLLFTIIAILLILRSSKYLKNELRIAPRKRPRDKFWIGFSVFLFSVIMTAIILFTAAMISSTIVSNRALAGIGTDAILPPLDPSFIEAFEFPLLLPTTLIGLGVFIMIYPFAEILYMGKKTSDGAMEIQKWFENHIVDRFQPPFSYIIAILTFLFIYIVPPTVVIILFRRFGAEIFSATQTTQFKFMAVMMIYLDWFMLFPIAYLTYYSTIGSSQAFFIGLKRNLVRAEKNPGNLFLNRPHFNNHHCE